MAAPYRAAPRFAARFPSDSRAANSERARSGRLFREPSGTRLVGARARARARDQPDGEKSGITDA